jgi:polysaccharide biosynthesis protein PslH
MRILVVERTFPWPETNGTSIRVANVVRALAQLGDVDFFLLAHGGTPASTTVPDGEPVARMARAAKAPHTSPRRGLRAHEAEWLLTTSLPFAVAMRDYSAIHSTFREWARSRYDLAWVGRAHAYVPLAGLIEAPTIVDFDDLEDRKIGAWLDVAPSVAALSKGESGRRGPAVLLRRWGSRAVNEVNLRRWRALEQRIAGAVERVVVCSELDRQRLGLPNAVVIANGYTPPERPAGRSEPGDPPTILFVGALAYAPNADAARFLVREILPRVRARLPSARVRIVGDGERRVADLASVNGVTLTGFADDIGSELALADAAAVPMRFGSGTRVKILEAFAHRVPVVSTALGCEGLGTIHDRHLLVAEDPDAFAAACADLLTDRELRHRLVDSAHELYWRRYRWDIIRPRISELGARVAESGERSQLGTPASHVPPR